MEGGKCSIQPAIQDDAKDITGLTSWGVPQDKNVLFSLCWPQCNLQDSFIITPNNTEMTKLLSFLL